MPSAAPSNIEVEITSRTLKYSWSELPCQTRNGEISYELELQDSDEVVARTEIRNNMYTFPYLIPFTRYTFSVKAITGAGKGLTSELIKSETSKDGTA